MPAPPSQPGADVRLRPATHADWARIDGWLALEQVRRWWGSHTAGQAAVLAALDAPMGLCSIIEADGRAVGYAHALDAIAGGLAGPDFSGCYRIDVFVGERAYRGRGIGVAALRLVTAEIFDTTLAPAAISIVSIRNEAAVRAHEKAGFAWVRVVEDALLGPCWLMRLERRAPG